MTAESSSYVPIIDLHRLLQDDATDEDKKAIAKEIGRACEKVGFFLITSHGVSQQVIDEAWKASQNFFDLPLEVKEDPAYQMTSSYPYGYSGFGAEVLSKSKGYEEEQHKKNHLLLRQEGRGEGPQGPEETENTSTATKTSAPDLKESFNIGPYDPKAGQPPIRWPEQPASLAPALTAYYKEMEKLSIKLLHCFALALQLPETWFDVKMDGHCSALRVLNYPDLHYAPQEGQLRASSHTDYGVLTILRQDDAPGGLQVMKRSGEWYKVPYIPGACVINLGDLMSRWTNDKWVSTPHRVICPPSDKYHTSNRRQSMAYFVSLEKNQMVECIETCLEGPQDQPKYPPINALQFLLEKHAAAVGAIPPSPSSSS